MAKDYKLFLNKQYGVDFCVARQLEREEIKYESIQRGKDSIDQYEKYNVNLTPVLIVIDNDEECDRLYSVEDIVNFLNPPIKKTKKTKKEDI